MKNKKLIGQKCDCYFTGAAMLCKLHAAAPDLLAAAEKVIRDMDVYFSVFGSAPTFPELRAAIAKAKGD